MKKILIFTLVFLLLISVSSAVPIPVLNSYVTDNAGILSSAAKLQLENELRDLEKQTNSMQYAIYIENEFPKEYSLEEYTLKIAETNRIGKKGNDNGILLYIAVKDRKYRWETGYGVESTLNSALLGRISRDYFVPNFRTGDYEKGVLSAVNVTIRILQNSNDADIMALKEYNQGYQKIPRLLPYASLIFLILFFTFIIISIRMSVKYNKKFKGRYKNNFYTGAAGGIFMGGFGRGGFGGGGSGGFGGFSGGGGGFGGGGFSGKF
ncbi:MAG: TPM domain-containing protein [Nanoarchaeota archaeon]